MGQLWVHTAAPILSLDSSAGPLHTASGCCSLNSVRSSWGGGAQAGEREAQGDPSHPLQLPDRKW